MPLFRMLPNLQQMPYQCSESSTAAEVSAVFDNAVSRARASASQGVEGACQTFPPIACSALPPLAVRQHHDIILVFLDEAGLPAERREALKVIHGYREHPSARLRPPSSNKPVPPLHACSRPPRGRMHHARQLEPRRGQAEPHAAGTELRKEERSLRSSHFT